MAVAGVFIDLSAILFIAFCGFMNLLKRADLQIF